MTIFVEPAHYLAFGSTDQQTLGQLTREYSGMLVPGTIAAFQADGTQGFVLSLSAQASHPYVIDPRSPLFQVTGAALKPSHLSLARVLGIEDEVDDGGRIGAVTWDAAAARRVAHGWLEFNRGFVSVRPKVFDKYARRLGEPLSAADADGPAYILAPYLMEGSHPSAGQVNDEIWNESQRMVEGTDEGSRLRRVIAVEEPELLSAAITRADQDEVAVWVNNLSELDPANALRLRTYAAEVARTSREGRKLFALYGGYFSVLLLRLGLTGSSHGVGFSEHRDYRELASSGASPARFYVEGMHCYIRTSLASELWRLDPELVAASYDSYEVARDPLEYEYHELMAHSVMARSAEITYATEHSLDDLVAELADAHEHYTTRLHDLPLTRAVRDRVLDRIHHLPSWVSALRH